MKKIRLPTVVQAVEFRREQYAFNSAKWAALIGMQRSHYSEFVHGKRNLTLKQAAACFALGVPAECLFQVRHWSRRP